MKVIKTSTIQGLDECKARKTYMSQKLKREERTKNLIPWRESRISRFSKHQIVFVEAKHLVYGMS